jgi:uncharacterized protein GlcG (DUF336 family)
MHNSGSAAKPLTYGRPIRLEDARMVMEAAEAEARRNGWPMVIAIVDSGGHLVMLHRCDDAQLGSLAVARLKAETAAKFKRPTKAVEDALASGAVNLRLLTVPDVTAIDGGLPLVRGEEVVGAIGVSGMLPVQDAEVAAAGVAALAG